MKIMTTVQFEVDKYKNLKDFAYKHKTTMADIIRKAVDLYMQLNYDKPVMYIDDNCD